MAQHNYSFKNNSSICNSLNQHQREAFSNYTWLTTPRFWFATTSPCDLKESLFVGDGEKRSGTVSINNIKRQLISDPKNHL